MPAHPHLHSVRDNLEMPTRVSHRLVAVAAIDDMINRPQLRQQWAHTKMALLLGVDQSFVSLVGSYISYRRTLRRIGVEKGIRPHGSSCAELFRYDTGVPLDIVNLGTSGDKAEQFAKLLEVAAYRKVRVEPEAVKEVERMLGRSCGMSWSDVVNAVQRQHAARNNVTPLPTTTTAMGVQAA